MLKYSEQKAIDIFCSSYDPEMTFKEICIEIESEDCDTVSIWDGMACMRGYDISTLIHATMEAIQDTVQNLTNDTLDIIEEYENASTRTETRSKNNSE